MSRLATVCCKVAAAAAVVSVVVLSAGCGSGGEDAPTEVVLLTHDSFAVSQEVRRGFERDSGLRLRILQAGDANEALNRALLTAGDPQADVIFGIDDSVLSRALDGELLDEYRSGELASVDPAFAAPDDRVTPIDHGEVCVNVDETDDAPPPVSFDDVLARAGDLVVENPATSSPGLAFLLATIAEYGEDGWQDWWRAAKDAGVTVSAGWEDAYYSAFSGGSGAGDKPLVVSYATSPPAEVVFADPPIEEATTGVVESTCFEQIEMAGILRGTEHEAEAKQLVDFLLSDELQADIPLQMYVFPVVDGIELPEVFTANAAMVDDPLSMTPEAIDEGRERWIEEWTSIVLG